MKLKVSGLVFSSPPDPELQLALNAGRPGFLHYFGGRFTHLDLYLSMLHHAGVRHTLLFSGDYPEETHQYLDNGWPDYPVKLLDMFGRRFVMPPEKQLLNFLKSELKTQLILINGSHPAYFDLNDLLDEVSRRRRVIRPIVDGKPAACLAVDRALLLNAVSEVYREHIEPVIFWDKVFQLLLQSKKLQDVPVSGYARTIKSVDQFIRTSFEVLKEQALFSKLFRRIPLHSGVAEKEQAVIGEGGAFYRSMISDSCVVEGTVKDSILYPGVKVARGALVEKSVLLPGCSIGSGAKVSRALVGTAGELPSNVKHHIGESAVLGTDRDKTVNEDHGAALANGYTFLAPGAYLPPRVEVGAGCYLAPGVNRAMFRRTKKITPGRTLSPARPASRKK